MYVLSAIARQRQVWSVYLYTWMYSSPRGLRVSMHAVDAQAIEGGYEQLKSLACARLCRDRIG